MWTGDFWAYETDLPPGSGFAPFSPPHLAWIGTALLLIILATWAARRMSTSHRRTFQQILAITLAMTYILRWTWAAVIGHFRLAEMLPLHLCAIAAIFETLAVFTRRPLFLEFGYACGLPGAVVVFLTPGIGPYPLIHFYYLLFILDHTILMLLPLLWITNKEHRPAWHRLPAVFAMVLVSAGAAVITNYYIGSNYMFLNFVPANTFWLVAAEWLGIPGYQLAMAGLLLVVWVILYIPWSLITTRAHQER